MVKTMTFDSRSYKIYLTRNADIILGGIQMKSFKMAYTISAMIVLILSIAVVIILELPIYLGILSTLIYMVLLSMFRGYDFGIIMGMILRKMRAVDYVAGMMLMIGGLVAIWMQIGTIPSLIYFGFTYLADFNLVLTAFVICMIMSLMIGSAIGTLSTIGVVFLAIGQGIGIPSGLMVGAIASGAYVGDRISPLASGGNLATAASGTTLTEVLKKMMKSNILPILTVGIMYFIIGNKYTLDSESAKTLEVVTSAIAKTFELNLIVVLPLIALLVSILVFRLGIIKSLGVATLLSAGIALFGQGHETIGLLSNYISGYSTQVPELASLIRGGGINSMWTVVLAILFSAGINGILEGTNMINPLLDRWIGVSKSPGKLVRKTIYTCVVVTVLTCNQSLTALLTGSYFADKFEAWGFERSDLARVILDTGIVIVALIPWNVNAIFFKSITGVSTVEYAPYAYYLWLVPFVTIISTLFMKDNVESLIKQQIKST